VDTMIGLLPMSPLLLWDATLPLLLAACARDVDVVALAAGWPASGA
jgi:hypothetical protein